MRRIFNHSARHTALLGLQVAMGGVLFSLLLVVAERHNHRFDLTPTKSYTLSDEAVRVAQNVHIPVRVTVFYNSQERGRRRQMEDLLQRFNDANPQIKYRLRDLDRSPGLAKKYNIAGFNTGVLEAHGQVEPLPGVDEEDITRGLLQLTRRRVRTLCFIAGHGEHSPEDASNRTGYSEVAMALEKEDFAIRTLDDIPQAGVPAVCTVVLIPGPTHDFLPGEADQLGRYLDKGGRVLLMIDPGAPQSVVQFLARYDVKAGKDIIVDEQNRFYGADAYMPRVPIFDAATFRKKLDTAAVFSVARTVSPSGKKGKGLKVLFIALSSPDSWAHMNGGVVPDGKVRFDRNKDKPGPLPVAVLVTDKRDVATGTKVIPKIGRMIVFGDSDFASNLYLNLLGNKDLFMSSIGVLTEDNALIAMRHKGVPRSSLSPIYLTARQGRLIFWTAVIAEPAAFAMLGLMITWRRRRRGAI